MHKVVSSQLGIAVEDVCVQQPFSFSLLPDHNIPSMHKKLIFLPLLMVETLVIQKLLL